ncbi:hypothetical protein BDR26DRAFT_599771 [Obelidium mucronatum]|nr:hypothetical protein BDR26DRAFT_599771 [Obelidium mucronatum]
MRPAHTPSGLNPTAGTHLSPHTQYTSGSRTPGQGPGGIGKGGNGAGSGTVHPGHTQHGHSRHISFDPATTANTPQSHILATSSNSLRGSSFGRQTSPNPFMSPRLRGARSRGTSIVGSFGNTGSIDRDSIMAMALYSRSPLLASSPSRDLEHVAGLSDQFCKDFVCCGLNMDNLHDLLQHFEEYHVSVNDDADSDSDDNFSDHNSEVRQSGGPSSIWNSYGRSRNFGGSFDEKERGASKGGILDESGGHLPFAFESHDLFRPQEGNLYHLNLLTQFLAPFLLHHGVLAPSFLLHLLLAPAQAHLHLIYYLHRLER